jgi:hypothetical protein
MGWSACFAGLNCCSATVEAAERLRQIGGSPDDEEDGGRDEDDGSAGSDIAIIR